LEEADRWVLRHGKFSVFISTFVPFFYSAVCLVAGTLRMRAVPFLLSCVLGFGLRFAFLEYAGYKSIYIFSSAFDYSQRFLFVALIVASTAYAGLYLAGVFRRLPTAG
ncbi:MAG TPA: VTT domain-containing protein, partial [Nitrososphaerales archaeon]|nr:VTT domain-containing protein [Nitrososphaerales archaeon]